MTPKFVLILWLFSGYHNILAMSYDWESSSFRAKVTPSAFAVGILAGPILTLGYTYAYIRSHQR